MRRSDRQRYTGEIVTVKRAGQVWAVRVDARPTGLVCFIEGGERLQRGDRAAIIGEAKQRLRGRQRHMGTLDTEWLMLNRGGGMPLTINGTIPKA